MFCRVLFLFCIASCVGFGDLFPNNPLEGDVFAARSGTNFIYREGKWFEESELLQVKVGPSTTDAEVIMRFDKPIGSYAIESTHDLEKWTPAAVSVIEEDADGVLTASFVSSPISEFFRLALHSNGSSQKAAVLLLEGQSNMFGWVAQGDYLPEDAPLSNMFQLSRGYAKSSGYASGLSGDFIPAYQPLQFTQNRDNGNTVSPGFHFARHYAEANPERDIFLICNAWGGTGFVNGRWNVGDDLHERGIAETLSTMSHLREVYRDVEFLGVLWHQGEQDSLSAAAADVYEGLAMARFNDQRARLGEGDYPIIVGTMLPQWIANATRRKIDAAHRNTVNILEKSAIADLSALTNNADVVHFGVADLRTAGQIFYDSWLSLLSN